MFSYQQESGDANYSRWNKLNRDHCQRKDQSHETLIKGLQHSLFCHQCVMFVIAICIISLFHYYHLHSTVKRERFFAQVYFSNETVSQTTEPMKMFRLEHETMNVCQRNVARFIHV